MVRLATASFTGPISLSTTDSFNQHLMVGEYLNLSRIDIDARGNSTRGNSKDKGPFKV